MIDQTLGKAVDAGLQLGEALVRFEYIAARSWIGYEHEDTTHIVIDQYYQTVKETHDSLLRALPEKERRGTARFSGSLSTFYREYRCRFGHQEHCEDADQRQWFEEAYDFDAYMLAHSPFLFCADTCQSASRTWRAVCDARDAVGLAADPTIQAALQIGRDMGYGLYGILHEFDNRCAVISRLETNVAMIERRFGGKLPRPIAEYTRSESVQDAVRLYFRRLSDPNVSEPGHLGLVANRPYVQRPGLKVQVRLTPTLWSVFDKLFRSGENGCTIGELEHAWEETCSRDARNRAISDLRKKLAPLRVDISYDGYRYRLVDGARGTANSSRRPRPRITSQSPTRRR